MDSVSCPGPMYKKVELINPSTERQSREVSRPSSTDSVRRSLTPTRIVQPIPRPWTATVTSGSNLYEQSYPIPEPPKVCKTVTEKEVCKREKIERIQPYREEHRAYRAEVCRREQITTKPPVPTTEEKKEEIKEIDTAVIDLRPPDDDVSDVAAHDFITETSEEDVGDMHIKKTITFETTMEPISHPEPEPIEELEQSEQIITRTSETHVDRTVEQEVESITERKTVCESAETVTSAVDATQLVEQAMRDEEERKREEEEEERRRLEEEERKRREEEERRRREEEDRIRREEEERTRKHVSFNEEEVEEVREQPLGRTVVREERVTETDTTPGRCKITKETYEEITEEVLVQERVRRKPIGDAERRRSLREQVEVHQSLRDQQPDRKRMSVKYGQGGETMETCKKHVQFMKQTESGPKPIPASAVKNATAQEWKSEMVNALTTASDRPYTPLSTSSSVKELYTEETIYLDHRGQPIQQEPQEEIRPISPFQQALMIAPERPYTPLSRPVGPDDVKPSDRAQTPVVQIAEKYPPPADILYGEGSYRPRETQEKVCQEKPRPLPTPPPGYHLRDSSPSPARSRSTTPCAGTTKPSSVRLRKPDTIPAYQRNLVAMKKEPVEGQPYTPSRTPTPTCGRTKSPAPPPSPQIPYQSRVQAPRMKDPSPPPSCSYTMKAPRIKESTPPVTNSVSASVHFPKRKGVSYRLEEDTETGRKKQEYAASRSVRYDEKLTDKSPDDRVHAQYQEHRYMTCEETAQEDGGPSFCKKALHVVEDFERCEKRETHNALEGSKSIELKRPSKEKCTISMVTQGPSTVSCQSRASQPSYSSTSEVRHVRYDTPSPKTCPETGVTVLPCKALSDRGTKAGVVVVPCEGPKTPCAKSGICIVPTPDRSGVCVSPCFGSRPSEGCVRSGACGQPTGCCGRQSSCDFDAPGCPESGICVTPRGDGSVCVAPCGKSSLKNQCGGSSRANIPYPQIPLPYEGCPQNSCSNGGCSTPPPVECKERAFEPIHKPRTNLSGQLARLTAKQNIPTVQLYKPIQNCQTGNQCQTQNHCQDQYHCSNSKTQSLVDPPNLSSHPDLGAGIGGLGGPGSKSGSFAGSSAPKRGRGILNQGGAPGSRLPLCGYCNSYVRGPFITALGQIWCPDHFVCVNTQCRRPLQDIGFVEEKGQLYCEYCFEKFIAPTCNKCNNKIKGDCLNAIGKHFHPECFNCAYCGKLFGNSPFFLEEGLPYCEADWNELFTTKCFACGFPVEAGDRWVEALNNNYHSQCFNCTMCKKNLEGQSFYAKGGRPFCKNHAR